jgi:hypothetical protein
VTLALEHDRSDEALNLGSFVLRLLSFLDNKGSLDDVLTDIVFLGQVEKLPKREKQQLRSLNLNRDI